jgi:hypothetical protein|tara:strand:- start:95 stop:331 length:237 start_codon:yes stop_codon:yes gene_type:complete
MFTNEFDWDETVTTVMDETGDYEDVQVMISDDGVAIRQFSENDDRPPDLVFLTHKMFKDMIYAMKLPEGFYKTTYKKD